MHRRKSKEVYSIQVIRFTKEKVKEGMGQGQELEIIAKTFQEIMISVIEEVTDPMEEKSNPKLDTK